MAEKILNTRIQLKYDTYVNWIANDPVLKKGEVAIATMATNEDGIQNTPNVIIKVGDGTSNYSALKFVSALAADVHTWAKKSDAEFKVWLQGLFAAGDELTVNKGTDGTVTYAHEAKLGKTFSGGATAATADAAGESVTIKVPKLTVNTYGHITSASDVEYKVTIPAAIVDTNTVTTVEAGNGAKVTDAGTNGNHVYTVSHGDVDKATNLTASGRKYVTGLTFDDYGHVTGYTTGTETVTNTDTTYTFAGGNGSFTVTPKGGNAQTVSIGKPSTAGTADKVANSFTVNGTAFDGSASKSVTIDAASLGVYTKAEVNELHATMKTGRMVQVDAKPTTGEEGIIYLVGTAAPYEMWIYEGGAWIDLGDTGVRLDNYYTKTEVGTQITNAIGALDSSKTVGSGKYVTGITLTDGKVTALSEGTVPTALKNPTALTVGSKTYDGSAAVTITATDLGIAAGATKVEDSTTNGNIKINGAENVVYTHPTATSKTSGLYKITVDGLGHVTGATAVAKADITGLGIPASDTNTAHTHSVGTGLKLTGSGGTSGDTKIEIDESVVFVFDCGTSSTNID